MSFATVSVALANDDTDYTGLLPLFVGTIVPLCVCFLGGRVLGLRQMLVRRRRRPSIRIKPKKCRDEG